MREWRAAAAGSYREGVGPGKYLRYAARGTTVRRAASAAQRGSGNTGRF